MTFLNVKIDRQSARELIEDAAGLAAICLLTFAGFTVPGLI